MAKESWKMLFGVENEYHTSRLAYNDPNLQHIIPHAIVAAAEEFGGFTENLCASLYEKDRKDWKRSVDRYEKVTDRIRANGYTGRRTPNRMRIYVDMGHPEISTAECTNPRDLLLQQKASERMIERMRAKATQLLGLENDPILVSKNNSSGLTRDAFIRESRGKTFDGMMHQSWATHENYLIPPFLFEELTLNNRRKMRYEISDTMTPRAGSWVAFLISRIYGGSGKMVSEMNRPACTYQIFQRADFIQHLRESDTIMHRGIINTRDHAYADPQKYRRLHVICGDALIAPWSIYVTYGATALFLKMLAEKFPMKHVAVKAPVETLWNISRDLSGKERIIELESGKKISALELQKKFLADMKRYLKTNEDAARTFGETVERLEFILNLFDANPERLKFYLDFAIKKAYLDMVADESGMTQQQLLLESLGYHNMNPDEGAYFLLEKEGFEDGDIAGIGSPGSIVTDAEIVHAITHPPEDSRAYFGGAIARRFSHEIYDYSWNTLSYAHHEGEARLFSYDPWIGTKEQVGTLIEESPDLSSLVDKMRKL